MAKDPDIESKLTQLADEVLDDLLSGDEAVTLDQRLDGLKVIGAMHLGLRKLNDKVKPDGEEAGGLPAMRERLRALAGGGN